MTRDERIEQAAAEAQAEIAAIAAAARRSIGQMIRYAIQKMRKRIAAHQDQEQSK